MLAKQILILFAFFMLTLITVNVEAMNAHSHNAKALSGVHLHSHAHQAVSPFADKLGNKRLHCELLGHNPLLPCPHHKMPAEKKRNCFLTNECSGGPFSAPAYQSAGDYLRFLTPPVIADEDLPFFAYVLSIPIFYNSTFYNSPDRPPQTL